MSVFSDLKKLAGKISRLESKVNGAINDLKRAGDRIQDGANNYDWLYRNFDRKARSAVEGILDAKVEAAARHMFEEFKEAAEELGEDVLEDLTAQAMKEVLNDAADVIEIMAPSSFTLTFGLELALVIQGELSISCSIPNPVAKLTEIRAWAEAPPRGRAQIIQCIKDFGPSSLSAGFGISGNGLSADWDGEDKYDRIDAFLEKHGVE